VKSDLARYKVPKEVEFLDELPRNATGKILKKELKEREENGDDGSDGSDGKRSKSRKSGGTRKKAAAKKG
jgi:acyl-CoA synthetase (AMP-forming)/AMP-acid ligase II